METLFGAKLYVIKMDKFHAQVQPLVLVFIVLCTILIQPEQVAQMEQIAQEVQVAQME